MSTDHEPLEALARVDMNQLLALERLLRLGSVTEAAAQLGVTQSAMSHTLRRLRETFDDPLLVRAGTSMVPTPRAQALQTPLRAALVALARSVGASGGFDPATTDRVFRVASPDLFEALVFPDLVARLARDAPGASIVVLPGFSELGARLETGDLDVVVAASLAGPPDVAMGPTLEGSLRTRKLLDDTFRAFVRAGHPALGAAPLELSAFADLDHVLVSPSGHGKGVTDTVLDAHGLSRRIAYRTPYFASAISVVQQTDLVLVAPGSLAHRTSRLGLAELPLPVELPRHKISLVWHPRFDADPGHRWLREQLLAGVDGLAAAEPPV